MSQKLKQTQDISLGDNLKKSSKIDPRTSCRTITVT